MARKGNGSGQGPGQGRGWGGPAKGAHPANPRYQFYEPGPGRRYYSEEGEARLERQTRHSEEMKEVLYNLAIDPTIENPVRVNAAEKLLNRLEGLPVAKTEQQDGGLTIIIEGGLPRRT